MARTKITGNGKLHHLHAMIRPNQYKYLKSRKTTLNRRGGSTNVNELIRAAIDLYAKVVGKVDLDGS